MALTKAMDGRGNAIDSSIRKLQRGYELQSGFEGQTPKRRRSKKKRRYYNYNSL